MSSCTANTMMLSSEHIWKRARSRPHGVKSESFYGYSGMSQASVSYKKIQERNRACAAPLILRAVVVRRVLSNRHVPNSTRKDDRPSHLASTGHAQRDIRMGGLKLRLTRRYRRLSADNDDDAKSTGGGV
ncbi:hypothetical protein GGP41_008148 [Bipolaris sorokiniana]|uniref:Uncharacterized protein n=1 Tax=Cochliobolus sativus TaxID=45130 RepID=A0A8H5ZPF4_COCSA|nr:hypothetical protein GGP41_008148 [Bipolaris sorokiniana]